MEPGLPTLQMFAQRKLMPGFCQVPSSEVRVLIVTTQCHDKCVIAMEMVGDRLHFAMIQSLSYMGQISYKKTWGQQEPESSIAS